MVELHKVIEAFKKYHPTDVFQSLLDQEASFCLFFDGEFNRREPLSILVWEPQSILINHEWHIPKCLDGFKGEVIRSDQPLEYLNKNINQTKGSPYKYGWYGGIGFDWGQESESFKGSPEGLPLFWFGYYQNILTYNHQTHVWDISPEGSRNFKISFLAESATSKNSSRIKVSDFKCSESKRAYQEKIEQIKDGIKKGDVYQVNYTIQFEANFEGNAFDLYKKYRLNSPVPFAAFLDLGDTQILSLSPELFLKKVNDKVTSAPIKGTIKRGEGEKEDTKNKLALKNSTKDQAELLMITDLVRNDLSKICKPNSVDVSPISEVETYSTVHHLVSYIHGELCTQYNVFDLFQALFPAGSISGTPKIASLKFISELEKRKRGFYSGCIGYFLDNQDALFNIAIRTFHVDKDTLYIQSGGGIVNDSVSDNEFDELLSKVSYVFDNI